MYTHVSQYLPDQPYICSSSVSIMLLHQGLLDSYTLKAHFGCLYCYRLEKIEAGSKGVLCYRL